jgi:hypothetical protein
VRTSRRQGILETTRRNRRRYETPQRVTPTQPSGQYGRVLKWEQLVVDARDPVSLGKWWAHALEWVVVNDDPDEFEIRSEPGRFPGILFATAPEEKSRKNRLHLDLRPDDHDGEVARLVSFGAKRTDVGQGEPSWIVLADPEGNEFCVLRSDRDG